MQLTDTTKFLQKAALVHDDKVLVLKRSEHSGSRPGAWDLPGGNAEWPTLTEPTADLHRGDIAREIREETGLHFDEALFTDDALIHFTTFFEPSRTRYAFICGWRVDAPVDFDPGSIQLSDEHTEYAWISLSELDSYDFDEPTGTFVKTIIRSALQKE